MQSDLCILTLVRRSQILLLFTAVHYKMSVLYWGMLWQSHLGINLKRIIQQNCITQLTISLGYKRKLF